MSSFLTTLQPLWVILCHLQEKGRKEFLSNNTSTLVGHFLSSCREKEKRDRRFIVRGKREIKEVEEKSENIGILT